MGAYSVTGTGQDSVGDTPQSKAIFLGSQQPYWNAQQISNISISGQKPLDGDVLVWVEVDGNWKPVPFGDLHGDEIPLPLAIEDGGTEGTTAAEARLNLELAQSGINSDITEITGLTIPLAVSQGGTGTNSLTGIVVGHGTGTMTAVTAPSSAVVGVSDSQALTNKVISKASNTLTGVAGSGANSDITSISGLVSPLSVGQGGTGINSLTGIVVGNGSSPFSSTTLPSGGIVGTSDIQTLTNKTINKSSNTLIGVAASGANSDIVSLSGLSTPLSVAQGGSGSASLSGIVVGNGSSAMTTVAAPTGSVVGTSDSQTLTNKVISKASNTLTGVAGSGANSDITSISGLVTPLSVAQGGSGSTSLSGLVVGNGSSAMSAVIAPAGAVVGTSDSQTLTNKTINKATNTLTGVAGSGANSDITSLTSTTLVNLSQTSAPGSPNVGDVWNDSTQKCLVTYDNGIKKNLTGCIFTSTSGKTVSNTGSETSLVGSGIGTVTLPANFFTVGKTLRIKCLGSISTDLVAGTLNFKVKLGSTVVNQTSAILLTNSLTGQLLGIEIILTCRTVGISGTVIASGSAGINASLVLSLLGLIPASAVTVDTTSSLTLDVTATWGTALSTNTLTIANTIIEVLN